MAGKRKSEVKRVPVELVDKINELKKEYQGMSDPEIMRRLFKAVINDKHEMIGKMMNDIRGKLFSIFERKEDVDELMESFICLSPILNDIMNTENPKDRSNKIELLEDLMTDVQNDYFDGKDEV